MSANIPAGPARQVFIAAATAALASGPAGGAPPPPALVPEALARPIDGYDLQIPFQLWRVWVEGKKGAASDALLTEPEIIENEQPFGPPLLRFAKYNDFGHFLTGEIRAYCRPARPYGFVPGTCHYRLRRAFIPHDAATYGVDNPISRWTRESFDALKLTAHLRASGFSPDTDWWRADSARMFATLPSPLPVLIANAALRRLDSRDCPAMGQAIEAMERKRIDWRLDLYAVRDDTTLSPPSPHAVSTLYTLRILTPGGGATIEGRDGALESLVRPVLLAADDCEADRRTIEADAVPKTPQVDN